MNERELSLLRFVVLPNAIWMLLWAALYVSKRDDLSFLTSIEPWFKGIRWFLYVPAIALMSYSVLTNRGGKTTATWGVAVAMFLASAGVSIIHNWVRKRCGIEQPIEAGEYWPTKPEDR